MSNPQASIARIRLLATRAERRIRLGRCLRVGVDALCVALIVAIADLALRKAGLLGEKPARLVLSLAGLGVSIAVALAWAWRLAPQAGARALDRFHDLHDRLASALSFADGKGEVTPFMQAAIEDALAVAPGVDPRAAVPIRAPRTIGVVLGLSAALTAVALFEVRRHVPIATAKTIDPVEMAPDDLDDVKDFLQQLAQKDQSDETKAAVEEFNKLVDDIANKRLDRTEAFRRMESLEEKLLTGSDADKKALEAQVEKIGEELKKSDLTKPAGEALADNKLDQAAQAMKDLAKKLREQGGQVDKAKLDQMREALKKAAADAEKRQQELEERRKELADDILKRKEKMGDGGGSDEERSLLEKKQRELERLDRQQQEQQNAGRQLDRLDRELEQAAEDLMKDAGLSAQDLEQSAEDINHMQQQQMTQQEKEELRQRLQEMRQLMRQQGQGKGQVARLMRFGRMARGQSGQGGQGQQGQGQQGDGQEGQDGQGQGQGQSGQGGQNGQGQSGQGGQGQGGQGGETWVIGPNGEKIMMLSRGQGQGGSGNGGQGGGGQSQPGGWGEGHDPKLQGNATHPNMGTEDTQVQGADTGQGGSRSQVILGAAERGFASRSYKKVYTEYHQVAEDSLSKDDIPGGYRFYVKRYFQLIRPREE
jgi:hypothetical protein